MPYEVCWFLVEWATAEVGLIVFLAWWLKRGERRERDTLRVR